MKEQDDIAVGPEFEVVRLVGSERRVDRSLAGVSRHWQGADESFLLISPHDDDAAIGAGLLIQLAGRDSVPVHVLIVTDGAMGYCSVRDRPAISSIRRAETLAAYAGLGVPGENIVWLGFPDCQLSGYLGRRPAADGDPALVAGFTGLQNGLTHHLRRIRPTQCFIPTHADLHPDHRIVHEELMISLFHAAGEIWPELGAPLPRPPFVNEYAVYCDFPTPPRLRIRGSQACLDRKLAALACFASQRQIGSLLQAVRAAGPDEYFRPCDLALYRPSNYRSLFDRQPAMSEVG